MKFGQSATDDISQVIQRNEEEFYDEIERWFNTKSIHFQYNARHKNALDWEAFCHPSPSLVLRQLTTVSSRCCTTSYKENYSISTIYCNIQTLLLE